MTDYRIEYVRPIEDPPDVVTGPDPTYETFELKTVSAFVATCRCGVHVLDQSQDGAVESLRAHIEVAHPAWFNRNIRCFAQTQFGNTRLHCGRPKGHSGEHAGVGPLFGGWYEWADAS